jgi:hypothetical protein
MRSGKQIFEKNYNPILDIIKSLSNLFSSKDAAMPLQFVRITEKFDVVQRSQHKGWVLRPDNE